MTAETDLPINDAVPAPTKIEPGNLFLWNWRQMQVYAQACVAHATAAKDAEIEALRAKAAEHRDGRLAALERAERLAEAQGGGEFDKVIEDALRRGTGMLRVEHVPHADLHAPPSAPVGVEGLQRYRAAANPDGKMQMYKDDTGVWVRLRDVEALAQQPAADCTCPHQDAREPDHDVACPARLAQQPAPSAPVGVGVGAALETLGRAVDKADRNMWEDTEELRAAVATVHRALTQQQEPTT